MAAGRGLETHSVAHAVVLMMYPTTNERLYAGGGRSVPRFQNVFVGKITTCISAREIGVESSNQRVSVPVNAQSGGRGITHSYLMAKLRVREAVPVLTPMPS